MTDCEKLIKHFKRGKSITDTEAIHKLGVYNTRSRISNLKDKGYPIMSQMVSVTRKDGRVSKVARYWLA